MAPLNSLERPFVRSILLALLAVVGNHAAGVYLAQAMLAGEVGQEQAWRLQLGLLALTLLVLAVLAWAGHRKTMRHLRKTQEKLRAEHGGLLQAHRQIEAQMEELAVLHQNEQALRAEAEQAHRDVEAREQRLRLSFLELQSTESALKGYADELELANRQLSEANVRAAELYMELEDALAREQARTAELELAQTQLVHAERMAAVTQLVAGISHELNNPINFVSAGTQGLQYALGELFPLVDRCQRLAMGQAESPEALRTAFEAIAWEELREDTLRLLDHVLEGTKRSANILRDLQRLSQQSQSAMAVFDLGEGLEMALRLLHVEAYPHLRIDKQYPEGTVTAMCQTGELLQAMLHLLSNALDAAKEQPEPWIGLVLERRGEAVAIRISDNGPGISPELAGKIFAPFFSTKEVGEGKGLGLSVSQAIAERHGGQIRLLSRQHPTVFELEIPVWHQPSALAT